MSLFNKLKKFKLEKRKEDLTRAMSMPQIIQGSSELENESAKEYRKGGYHPVNLGDVLDQKRGNYYVMGKLGYGHFSTVWLCYDFDNKDYVAVKIVKSAQQYSEAALDEIKLCSDLRGCQGVIQLYDHFTLRGPNGKHICMVFELGGENLLSLIRKFQYRKLVMPVSLVKQITKDMLISLIGQKQKYIIHTDLKPENVLLTHIPNRVQKLIDEFEKKPLPKRPKKKMTRKASTKRPKISQLKIKNSVYKDSLVCKFTDYGNACWVHKKFTDEIQTRQYRSPEVILGKGYSISADLWSLAAIIFELMTYEYLFNPKKGKGYSKNDDHLARMVELLGPPDPKTILGGKKSSKYFTHQGKMKRIQKMKFWSLSSVLIEKYDFEESLAEEFSDFLTKMLNFDPKKRYPPELLLQHPFLQMNNEKKHNHDYFYNMYKDYY